MPDLDQKMDLQQELQQVKPTLLVEGLAAMVQRLGEPIKHFEHIEDYLQRGESHRMPALPLESLVWMLCGQQQSPPVAAITRAIDQPNDATGLWMRADPVWLRADISRVFLAATNQLALSQIETKALTQVLSPWLEEAGLSFDAPNASRWYIRLDSAEASPLPNPNQILGQDLAPVFSQAMESGSQASFWYGLMNEMQMLLFQNEVNEQRRQYGMPEANSLWFWGSGELDADVHFPYQLKHAQHVMITGLNDWQELDDGSRNAERDHKALLWHWCPQADETAEQALERLNQLFADAMRFSLTHSGVELRLISDDGFYCLLKSPSLIQRIKSFRFWKGSFSLPSYIRSMST